MDTSPQVLRFQGAQASTEIYAMLTMIDLAKQAMEVMRESHVQQSTAFSKMREQIELMRVGGPARKHMEKDPQFHLYSGRQ